MNWVNKHKLPAIEMIKYNGQPCLKLGDLWQVLHLSFNTAQFHYTDKNILNEIGLFTSTSWKQFLEEEFTSAITKCNNLSALSLDKLLWRYFKHILKDKLCLKNIIKIANMCIEVGYWPTYFKTLITIIILKPNNTLYNMPKFFRPIVLLNILGKLIEKVIGDRFQFHVISNNFIHQSQLGGLKFKSTMDASITLTHFIYMGWVKNLLTSTLAFDIVQFFLLFNHHLLSLILGKVEFDFHIINFFFNYLINRKTLEQFHFFFL